MLQDKEKTPTKNTLVQIVLTPELIEKLDYIQSEQGMRTRTEAIRHSINYYHKFIK